MSLSYERWRGDSFIQETLPPGRFRLGKAAFSPQDRRILRKRLGQLGGVQVQWVQILDCSAGHSGPQVFWRCSGTILRERARPVSLQYFSHGPRPPIGPVLALIQRLKRSADFIHIAPDKVHLPAELWARLLEGRINQIERADFAEIETRVVPEGDSDSDEGQTGRELLRPEARPLETIETVRYWADYYCPSNGLLCRDAHALNWVWMDFPDAPSLAIQKIQFRGRPRVCPLSSGWVALSDGVWQP